MARSTRPTAAIARSTATAGAARAPPRQQQQQQRRARRAATHARHGEQREDSRRSRARRADVPVDRAAHVVRNLVRVLLARPARGRAAAAQIKVRLEHGQRGNPGDDGASEAEHLSEHDFARAENQRGPGGRARGPLLLDVNVNAGPALRFLELERAEPPDRLVVVVGALVEYGYSARHAGHAGFEVLRRRLHVVRVAPRRWRGTAPRDSDSQKWVSDDPPGSETDPR